MTKNCFQIHIERTKLSNLQQQKKNAIYKKILPRSLIYSANVLQSEQRARPVNPRSSHSLELNLLIFSSFPETNRIDSRKRRIGKFRIELSEENEDMFFLYPFFYQTSLDMERIRCSRILPSRENVILSWTLRSLDKTGPFFSKQAL